MFDLKVQHRDPKTGGITQVNPYRLYIKGNTKYYERPVGSGNMWYEDGTPYGEHKPYKAPLTQDQKLAAEMSAKDSQLRVMNDKLEAKEKELKLIQEEAAKKQEPQKKEEAKDGKQTGNVPTGNTK